MKVFRFILILTMGILTACGTTEPELPTQVILPTDIPTETATSTPTVTPSATPSPTPTAQTIAPPSSTNETALVAFLHTIPDFSEVDIYIEASAYAFAMGYGQSTQPSEITSGTYTIRVMPAGVSLRDNVAPIFSQQVTLNPQATTVLILSGTPQTPQFNPYLLSTEPLDAGLSRVSLINLVSDVPNLTLREAGIDIALPVVYGGQTIPTNIRSGRTTLMVQTGETAVSTQVLSFRERENVALVVYGTASELAIARFANIVSGRTTVRLINMSPAATLIDVYLNNNLFFANSDFGRATERQQIASGDYRVDVYSGGADISRSTPIYTTTITPRQDDTLTLVFMGASDSLNLATVNDDLSPMPPNQSRLTVINAMPDSGIVQPSYQANAIPFMGRVAYGQASNSTLINAEIQSLYFITNVGPDQASVEVAENLQFEAGVSYLYFITGRTEDVPPLILSERLGVDEQLALNYESEPTQAPLLPVRVQVVNMLYDRATIDVLVDGSPAASGLPYAQLSQPVIVSSATSDMSLISVRLPGSETNLGTRQYNFQREYVHTIYVYGNTVEAPQIAIRLEEPLPEGLSSAFIRLNNFTMNPDVRFNLSVADAAVDPVRPPDFTPLPVVQFREEMFASAEPVILDISGGEISTTVRVPARLTDLYLIDLQYGLVAYKQLDVNFEPGRVYDVIVVQNPNDIQVNLLIIAHPVQTG